MTNTYRISTIIFTSLVAGTSAVYGQVTASSDSGATAAAPMTEAHQRSRPALPVVSPPAEPVVTPVADEPDADSELARRMRAALRGERQASNSPARQTDAPEPPRRVWRCSGWEELWQGRGRARTCEWQ